MAGLLVGAEAVALLAVAGAELLSLSGDRLGLGRRHRGVLRVLRRWSSAGPAGGSGAGLGSARGPAVVAQLIGLGLAWSTRSEVPLVAVLLAGCSVAVLVLVLRPSATQTLGD